LPPCRTRVTLWLTTGFDWKHQTMNVQCLLGSLRANIMGSGLIGPGHVEGLRRIKVRVAAWGGVPESVQAVAGRVGILPGFGDCRAGLRLNCLLFFWPQVVRPD
jgi:hypothetical protein